MNIDVLRGKIHEKCKTGGRFAESMGWHPNKVSAMLNGKYIPDVDEAAQIATRLDLTEATFCEIFLH